MSITTARRGNHIKAIFDRFSQSPAFEDLLRRLSGDYTSPITLSGLAGSSVSFVLAVLTEFIKGPIIGIFSDQEEAEDIYDDLVALLGEMGICHFPSLQVPPFEFRSPTGEIVGTRLASLSRLLQNDTKAVIAPISAVIEPTITLNDFKRAGLLLKTGDEAEIISIAEKLATMGFNRVPLVEEVGDYALRGGLLDFFSPGFDHPVRIEFFGDTIETIRQFDVAAQRTTGRLDEINLLPRREVFITENSIENYIGMMSEKDADLVRARYLNDPELPGLEWLASGFGIERGCLTDFLPENAVFVLQGYSGFEVIINDIFQDASRHLERLKSRMQQPPEVEDYYKNKDRFLKFLEGRRIIDLVPFKGGRKNIIDFQCRDHPALGSRFDLIAKTLQQFSRERIEFFVAVDNAGQGERLNELLSDKIDSDMYVPIEVARLKAGFVSNENKIAVLTDHQIFSRRVRQIRRRKFREGVAIQNYTSLVNGDYVVHIDFGIARYDGLKSINISGRTRDCLLLKYEGGDKLYVPIEEFNRVSKYSGKDSAPKLSSLGGPGWKKIKARTKKAIEEMAADLIKIYAERKTQPGFAFSPDTPWMRQLEASFPYNETEDQIKAIADIKKDMEQAVPMDRLICGDVGFGKTEVAIRATLKAIEDGKQVAILVPTTILAQQHLTTFNQRLGDFPIRIEMLSRFRSKIEQKKIIEELAAGKIEVVIGTHRLLSKDVQFADLGLLIVDEEQRFGVKHKETLRKIKTTVDTMAMTATPIPRTLQMSLMGARDMSVINTSPKDRHPVITQISEFDPDVIAEAILSEVDRDGQIFFVHNRVQSIEAIYRYLKKLLPQVEIAVAHGQMHERSLEGIMLAFLAGKFQVLLATSIIESGLDIPNVNTIVINRADKFGLAQLYQLRGRVGRSSVRARAHLLTPQYRLITEDARKRLRAIEAHADLGSGFALAMKDLEIRGAGNILGPQQSGFIEEVGFDLYTKMLEEAVAELKGEEVMRPPETKIEMTIDILIPDFYINIYQQKVEVYQKVAGARRLEEVEHIRDEISDRFGRPPDSVNNLLDAAAVRISAWAHGIHKVKIKSTRAELVFGEGKKLDRREIEAWRRVVDCPMEFSIAKEILIKLDLSQIGKNDRLRYLRAVLNRI